MTFPKAARHYGVVLPSEGVKIELENYCLFGTLSINMDSWQISDTPTETPIIAPRHVRFSARVTKRLINIMAGVYTVDIFVVHTHKNLFSEPQGIAIVHWTPNFMIWNNTILLGRNQWPITLHTHIVQE